MQAKSIPASTLGFTTPRWAGVASCSSPVPRVSLPPVRVLIAGDHPTLRTSLRTILEMDKRIEVVGEAADDCDLVKMSKRLHPDVVLLDLDMHCCDSFEAVGEVTRRRLSGAIVGLTIHEDSRERDAARKAGVSYFLEKGISSRQLVDTVKRLGSEAPTP